MSEANDVRWGRWVGAIAGVFLLLKSAGFVIRRLVGVARNEIQDRGGDVAFVLGLAERRRNGRA